jgi:CDP-4-dehydro-6-deoxyglucose reductase, E1
MNKFISTGKAIYNQKEISAVTTTLNAQYLGLNKKGEEFEKKFAQILGQKYSVLTNSGSSSSLLAMEALKKAHNLKRGEIITPACGFPTTVNPIIQLGLTPVFVDINKTLNPSYKSVESAINKNTKGIVLAHTLGNPFEADKIKKVALENKLFLLEDTCDAYGSKYKNKPCGSYGNVSTASFYPAHNITLAGEGGAIGTSNNMYYKHIKSFRDWGRDCTCMSGQDNRCGKRFEYTLNNIPYDHKYIYSNIGYNLKPTELQAAFGLEQLKRLNKFNQRRKENYETYLNEFNEFKKYFEFIKINKGADPVMFGFPLIIKNDLIDRKKLILFLNENKIGTRFLFGGNLTYHPMYKNVKYKIQDNLDYTDHITKNLFWIGNHPDINKKNILYIKSILIKYIEGLN